MGRKDEGGRKRERGKVLRGGDGLVSRGWSRVG